MTSTPFDWKTGKARILRECPVGSVVVLPTFEIITVQPGNFRGCYNNSIVFYVADAKKNCNSRVSYQRAAVLKRYLECFEVSKTAWVYKTILDHFKEIADSAELKCFKPRGRLFITRTYSVPVPKWQ